MTSSHVLTLYSLHVLSMSNRVFVSKQIKYYIVYLVYKIVIKNYQIIFPFVFFCNDCIFCRFGENLPI